MMVLLNRILTSLQDAVWPQKVQCLLCDEYSHGQWLCQECAEAMDRLRIRRQDEEVRSAYIYKHGARELIHALKYDALRPAAEVFAGAMAEIVREMVLPPDTMLTWVTTTRKRRLTRGGDHGKELCAAVARRLDMPMRQTLMRVRSASTQRGLSGQARQTNLRGVFVCPEEIRVPVLIVDDVHTTGATVRMCTEALLAAGAPAVYAVTATRVLSRDGSEDETELPRKADEYGLYAAGMGWPGPAERQHLRGSRDDTGAGERRDAPEREGDDAPSPDVHEGRGAEWPG